MLETTECIFILNNDITYTDCMEFSLLRFLQILLFNPKQINTDGFSKYPENLNCNRKLKRHIIEYPKIYPSASYYLDQGKLERSDWADLLCGLDFMKYYRSDNRELFTNIENIYSFFNGFLLMGLDLSDEDKNLHIIADKFSNKNKKIVMCIKERSVAKKDTRMKEIVDLLSRPDEEYSHFIDKKYNITTQNTTIFISINDTNYEWKLNEVYFEKDSCPFSNRFITGHSVIMKLN